MTLLPLLAAPTEAHRAGLVVRSFAEPAPNRTIALVWRRRSPLATVPRRLAATMRLAYPRPASLVVAPRVSPRRGGRSGAA